MPRVKRGTTKQKSRRTLLSKVKGYRFGRSTKKRAATEALMHAGAHAFAHRRKKKGDFRGLFQIRIGAAARTLGHSYSGLMGAFKKKEIGLDRKTLAGLAKDRPEVFERVVKKLSS